MKLRTQPITATSFSLLRKDDMLAVCLAQKGEQERAGSSPVKKKEDREREREHSCAGPACSWLRRSKRESARERERERESERDGDCAGLPPSCAEEEEERHGRASLSLLEGVLPRARGLCRISECEKLATAVSI